MWIPPVCIIGIILKYKSYRGNVFRFKAFTSVAFILQDNETKLGESKETHCIYAASYVAGSYTTTHVRSTVPS